LRAEGSALASKASAGQSGTFGEERAMTIVVTCECGWTTRGNEDRVIEAMQVHGRQIHRWELTRDQVLEKAIRQGPD
jgi:predicted small metal-binding protein